MCSRHYQVAYCGAMTLVLSIFIFGYSTREKVTAGDLKTSDGKLVLWFSEAIKIEAMACKPRPAELLETARNETGRQARLELWRRLS